MSISPDRILYSDDHLLAVNKLSGELAVRGKGDLQKLPLFDFLHKDYPGLRVVHRLDFETSGVMIFARSKRAADAILDTKFDRWKKIYRALIKGTPLRREGNIDFELPAREGGHVDAHTEYRVLQSFGEVSDVEAMITTGRHHQIRRHFARIKHPLVLDEIYGDEKFNKLFGRAFKYRKFFLHASRLELPHPITGEMMTIEAPLPKAYEAILKKCKGQSAR